MNWLRASGDGVLLTLHIQPGAKQTEIVGLHGDALKLRLAAPPVDGKANKVLMAFLARKLGVPKSQIVLVSGQASRSKRIAVRKIAVTEVERLLRSDLSPQTNLSTTKLVRQ